MKRSSPILLTMALAVLAGCVKPEVAMNRRADFSKINRVAVATFGGPGGDVAADLMTQDLLQLGADVIERSRLEAVLNEHHLAAQNILDPKTAKKVGKILGVDAIFVGTVATNVPSQSYVVSNPRHSINVNTVTPVGGGDVYSQGPVFGIPDSQVITSAAQASLISRLVDVETGSILWSGRMGYEGLDIQDAMGVITSALVKTLVPVWPSVRK